MNTQYCTSPPSNLVTGAVVASYNQAYNTTSIFNCSNDYVVGLDGEPTYLCAKGTASSGIWTYINGSCFSRGFDEVIIKWCRNNNTYSMYKYVFVDLFLPWMINCSLNSSCRDWFILLTDSWQRARHLLLCERFFQSAGGHHQRRVLCTRLHFSPVRLSNLRLSTI